MPAPSRALIFSANAVFATYVRALGTKSNTPVTTASPKPAHVQRIWLPGLRILRQPHQWQQAVGQGVDFTIGTRVAGFGPSRGAYATARVMGARHLVRLPEAVSFEDAAAAMLKGLTVQYLFRRTVHVGPETTVLFHAAAGGVGLIACQWARSEGIVRGALEAFGGLDILVSNPAYSRRGDFLEYDAETFRKVIQGTLTGGFYVSQLVARHMVERGEGGKIVFISSIHARMPYARSVAYNAGKAGLNQMAFTIAADA